MAEFLVLAFIIVACVMIFGKADSKKNVLNSVGLDLSEQKYQYSKENEFAKYCKKAMKTAISDYDANGNNEKEFLEKLKHVLYYASHNRGGHYDEVGRYYEDPDYRLYVKTHYTRFAETVVRRRIDDLNKGSDKVLMNNCDYKSKHDLKNYVDRLWEKYQYPWPDNWMINDGI